MLDTKALSSPEALELASVLAKAGVGLGELPRIGSLFDDHKISLAQRISILKSFLRPEGDDPDASARLLAIVNEEGTTYAQAIDALKTLNGPRSRDLLASFVDDAAIPPKWRLTAASPIGFPFGPRDGWTGLLRLIHDESVSIRMRLLTLSKLPKLFANDERAALLPRISCTPALGNWERIAIAKAAMDIKAIDLAKALLNEALSEAPLSIAEVCDIAKSLHALGETKRALALLQTLIVLPTIILKETEDLSSAIEAAKLMAKLGEKSKAADFLAGLVHLASSWVVVEVLEAIKEIAGKEAAKCAASNLITEVISALKDPSQDYIGYWHRVFEYFLSNDWISDLRPLLVVAEDHSKLLSDRAEAAAAIYRNGWRDKSQDWERIAQCTLTGLAANKELSTRDLIELVPVLRVTGLVKRAEQIVGELLDVEQLKPEDRRALANLLAKTGDVMGAKVSLEAISEEDEGAGYLGPWDEELIVKLRGEEHLANVLMTRAFDEKEPLFDRVFQARDLVSKIWRQASLAASPWDRYRRSRRHR